MRKPCFGENLHDLTLEKVQELLHRFLKAETAFWHPFLSQ